MITLEPVTGIVSTTHLPIKVGFHRRKPLLYDSTSMWDIYDGTLRFQHCGSEWSWMVCVWIWLWISNDIHPNLGVMVEPGTLNDGNMFMGRSWTQHGWNRQNIEPAMDLSLWAVENPQIDMSLRSPETTSYSYIQISYCFWYLDRMPTFFFVYFWLAIFCENPLTYHSSDLWTWGHYNLPMYVYINICVYMYIYIFICIYIYVNM